MLSLLSNPASLFAQAGVDWPAAPELRWQLTGFAVGVVILSFGVAGLSLVLFQRKAADRSLVYFSIFAILYAIRLLFRQGFLHSLVPASQRFWKYSDVLVNNFIDNFIVALLTLLVIEMVEERWKTFLRWLLGFQIAFATMRFFSTFFGVGKRPVEITYHILIVAYCSLLVAYPFTFRRGQLMPRELKVVYAGLTVFGLFVARNNLSYIGILRGPTWRLLAFSR